MNVFLEVQCASYAASRCSDVDDTRVVAGVDLIHVVLSSNSGVDIPAQMHRLARAFAARIHKIYM